MARERRERVHGPYKHGKRWRVVVVRADGDQDIESFETEAEAQGVADAARRQATGRTLTFAVDMYEVGLRERGLASVSIARQRAHLDKLLGLKKNGHRFINWLTPKRADALYVALRTSNRELLGHRARQRAQRTITLHDCEQCDESVLDRLHGRRRPPAIAKVSNEGGDARTEVAR